MNKRQIIASLNKIANTLDLSGLYKEASSLTGVMKKIAAEYDPNIDMGVENPELDNKFNRGISDTPSYIGNEQNLYNPKEFGLVVKTSDYRNNTISVGIFGQIFLLKKYDNVSKEFVDNNGINETEVYATTDSVATSDITSSVDYATDKNGNIVDFIGRPIKVGNIEVAQYDFPQLLNWEDAKKACASIGNGWRLPDINELYILYNNKDKIGNFVQNGYWSSSETNWTGGALYVNFGNGDESGNRQGEGEKINPTYVRIVRTH